MYPNIPIRSWAVEDRPREKMLQRGLSSLTDAELLAILLATGTREKSALDLARDILQASGSLQDLARFDVKRLTKIRGVGPAKALTLISAFEIGRRKQSEDGTRTKLGSPEEVANYLIPKMGDLNQETFWVLFLNRKNEIISEKNIFTGGLAATVVDVRVVYKEAVERLASSIVVAHNHPSGNLMPSDADREITHKLVEAGKLLDIPCMDHLIITARGYYSLVENGAM